MIKQNNITLFCSDEKGGGIVEVVLVTALIALAAIVAMTSLGTKISTDFTSISSKL